MPRLSRSQVTWLLYLQLGIWGYFLYGFGPVVPLLRDEQGTTAAVASLHGTGLAAGGVIGGALFGLLVRRFGRGAAMWAALLGLAVAVGVLCLMRPLPATLAATVACSVFGTVIVNCAVASLTDEHGSLAPAAISEANAVAAGLGILAPILVGLGVRAGWGWRPGLAAVAILTALLVVVAYTIGVRLPTASRPVGEPGARVGVRAGADDSAGTVGADDPAGGDRSGGVAVRAERSPLPRAYWLAWSLLIMTGSIEVCLGLWAADVLRGHASMSPGAASAAVASIVGGMFLGRLVGGRLAARIAPGPLMIAALGLSSAGFALFWLATAGWLAVTGLLVLGLGNAMHYPLGISMALFAANGQVDRAAAYSSYALAAGFGLAPLALGWIADGVGSHRAFLLVPLFIVAAATLVRMLGRTLNRAPVVVGAA